MQKLVILTCLLSIFVLSGCEVFSKAKQDAENFTGSVIQTKKDIEAASEKLDETIREAKAAADQINSAKEAINQLVK